jgi:AraC-like DNA-binding protein
MARRQPGFTRASSLGPIGDFVDAQGGSITRVLQDVDLPFALLESPEMLVPLREQFRLLERAARETGDSQFGARLGQNVKFKNLSAFGKWVGEAATLEAAIHRAAHGLNAMLQTSTVLTLTRHGPIAQWSIEFLDPGYEGRYQNELLGLCYMMDVVRYYAGPSWAPNLVLTTAARGVSKSALEQILNAEVSTGHAVPAFQFDRRFLDDGPRRGKEPNAQPGIQRTAEPPMPAQDDDLDTIAAVTALALSERYPRIDWVASKLGMTRRSLQRRLAEKGTTFNRLSEELLRDRAKALLTQAGESITDIALNLGYTDTAHFTRAFKRWTGVSPSAYRRIHN